MDEAQKKDNKEISNTSSKAVKPDNIDDTTDLQSNLPKKQKTTNDNIECNSKISTNESKPKPPPVTHYQDTCFNEKSFTYRSFSSSNKTSSVSKEKSESKPFNPVQQIIEQAVTVATDQDSDEDEQQKKISAAKKLLFPNALATSFSEVADSLRNERRQEFCPIYQDEAPNKTTLRQQKQKPVGSLLAKRIRWDDLKRKREEEEKKAQMQFRYGPYGPVYSNTQQSQPSFANPYEQYYTAMQNQYEQMVQMTRAQQEHSGFWPEYQQQPSFQNNDRMAQNSMQPQIQPYTYTYPYSTMYPTNTNDMNRNAAQSYMTTNQNSYYSNMMPPPPPPDEPYPY